MDSSRRRKKQNERCFYCNAVNDAGQFNVNAECYAEYAEYVVGKADECKERMKKA